MKIKKERKKKLKHENDNNIEFKPEYVEKIKRIEKRAKFVKLDIDELFRKTAEEG